MYRRRGTGLRAATLMAALLLAACNGEREPIAAAPAMPAEVAPATPTGASSLVPSIDPASGLIIDEGWELVRGTCAACHSASLVTQNRGDRETWEGMIRWMQESQGLWPLDPQTEAAILDYLAKNYAPVGSSRRAPLPSELMPANPYEPGVS